MPDDDKKEDDKEALMPSHNLDWLSEQESRFDEQLLLTLPAEQREELSLVMQGVSIGGIEVDLGRYELKHDDALTLRLTDAQRTELALITRGESAGGRVLDLDRLEESLDRQVG